MLTKLLKAAAAFSGRPPRGEVEPVALELIGRYGGEIMAVARRYAETREDAEDAYQRGLEILLTKAPSIDEEHLLPWLKTVVRHEAYALRRQRERSQPRADAPALTDDTEAHVERIERLQVGAEALARLKPQETRCLVLLAEGHSYQQIQELTGFSYTKVNRCLVEGRRNFLRRVERIESGAECERMAPLLSALADGEAGARDLALLRPHLRTCLSCRAALRDAREVPSQVAALAAPVGVVAVAVRGSSGDAGLRGAFEWLQERVTLFALRAQDVVEAAASHKLAAAAASAAVVGGGGIATVSGAYPERDQQRERHAVAVAGAVRAVPRWRPAAGAGAASLAAAAPSSAAPASVPARRRERKRSATRRPAPARARAPAPAPAPAPAAKPSTEPPPPTPPIEPAARVQPGAAPPRDHPPPPPPGSTGEFGP